MTVEKRIRNYSTLTVFGLSLTIMGVILSGQILIGLIALSLVLLIGSLPIYLELRSLKKNRKEFNWHNGILIVADITEIFIGILLFFPCLLFYIDTGLPLAIIAGIFISGSFISNSLIWTIVRIKKKKQPKKIKIWKDIKF